MKKRFLSTTLILAMASSLVACSGSSESTTTTAAAAAAAATTAAAVETTVADVVETAAAGATVDPSTIVAEEKDLAGLANATYVNENTTGMYPGTAGSNSMSVECTTISVMSTLLMTYNNELSFARHAYDALVKLDAENNIVGAGATSWDVSDDGLVYTFHLREGMKWVDSTGAEYADVTAGDYAFAWKELLNPENAAEYYNFATIIKNAGAYYESASGVEGAPEVTADDLGIKVIDDLTLEVTLEYYIPYALQNFKFEVLSPICQKFYEEIGAENYATSPENSVYNGPFYMSEWITESSITLKKNPFWWDAANVQLEELKFVKYTDTNTKYNAFLGGEIDLIDVTGEQSLLFGQEGYKVNSYAGGYSYFYRCNVLEEEDLEKYPGAYYSDARSPSLRKAISYAIDRQQIIDTIYKNQNESSGAFTFGISGVADTSFTDVVVAANGGEPLYSPTADADKAKEYLAAAVEELGYSDASEIKLTLLTSEGTQNEQVSQVVQEQVRAALGITLDIEITTITESRARRNAYQYDLFFGGWGPDYNDPMTDLDLWTSASGNNYTGYANEEYDAIIEATKLETDPAAREQLFVEAEFLIQEDLPIIPVYHKAEEYVQSEKIVSGAIRRAFQPYYFTYTTLAK